MLAISPPSYIAGILFLLLMGLFYLLILIVSSETPQDTLPSTEFFNIFWVPVFFLVPLLTMKSIAEERRLGTWEALRSTPVNTATIVFSKFLGAYAFYLFLWSLTLFFPLITSLVIPSLQSNGQLFNSASLIGGYSFIAISGFLYIALGILASSLTRSQLVAGMLSFCFLFLFILGGKLLLETPLIGDQETLLIAEFKDYCQSFKQLSDFSRGIIDTRPFIFYLCNGLFALGITTVLMDKKA